MKALDLRNMYLSYFSQLGHQVIPSASLRPENDPSVLFTTAGMHPLVPFLLGETHPAGKRLVNYQRCLRTNDIDEVGDPSHLTFFEMLGNWSLGSYFKEESLVWSYRYLSRELGIDASRLAVTVFAGDADAPRDELSAGIWRKLGLPDERIFFLPKSDNWWGPVGASGPCGPDSEMFIDTGRPDHPGCQPGCSCGKWLEVWNNVFMEYEKLPSGAYRKLAQCNVDTGMGLERTLSIIDNHEDVFGVDTLAPLIGMLEELTGQAYRDAAKSMRIIADHLRASVMAVADHVEPSNVEAGYVVRRMLRRAIWYGRKLGLRDNFCSQMVSPVIDTLLDAYPHLEGQAPKIIQILDLEETKFTRTLERGTNEYGKLIQQYRARNEKTISGEDTFYLFETFGIPFLLTQEMARSEGMEIDEKGFAAAQAAHRQQSRHASEGRFKGGLLDQGSQTTRLHTATHLLHQALRLVLGDQVHQMGSNITHERLRFDFAYPNRLSAEQLELVGQLVNQQIADDLEVSMEIMSLDEVVTAGALAFFGEKYGQQVKVYTVGGFSKEVCGGPHVDHTALLGRFQITKEEAVGQGVRRIRATLDEMPS